jgi:hypothetical protein
MIGLATFDGRPELTLDDERLAAALEQRGVATIVQPWSGPLAAWRGCAGIVVRSCWDYHLRLPGFLDWIEELASSGLPIHNRGPLIRWNADKVYLRELADKGIAVVPTEWVEPGDTRALRAVLQQAGWHDAVVKPSVSASAYGLWRASLASATLDEVPYRELLERGRVMVQPFLPEIEQSGELSLVFLDGRFSHAVIKRAKAGDFRVQDQFGGSRRAVRPDAAVVAAARSALACAPEPPLYARLDGCLIDGRFVLMELELIEPELFFATAPEAASALADALMREAGLAGGLARTT